MSNTLQTPILTVFLWLFTPNTTDYRQNTYTIGYRPDLVLKLLLSSYCIHRWWMKLLLWQRCWQQQIMNVCQNSSSILQLPGNLLEENKPFFQTASHHLVFWWWFYKCSLTLQCVCVCRPADCEGSNMCLLHPEDGRFSPWNRSPTSGLQSKDKGDHPEKLCIDLEWCQKTKRFQSLLVFLQVERIFGIGYSYPWRVVVFLQVVHIK